MRIDAKALESFNADTTRTLYMFDVRDPTDYAAGHFPGAVNAPGGQLVQATDQYAATLGARIVLIDDREVRAVMTASWLKQMGWRDVFVLAASGSEKGRPPASVLGAGPPADRAIEAKGLSELVAKDRVIVIDLSLSPAYRKGHIPGAWFAITSRRAKPACRRVIYAAATPPGRQPDSRFRPSHAWPTSRWTTGRSPTSVPTTPRAP